MALWSEATRDAFLASPLYKPLRYVYQSIFDREAIRRRARRRQFYSNLLKPGDLVFDVGANLGNYTEAYCAVGAEVVAVEPDPRNVEVLRKRLRRDNVHIEGCALSSREGTGELHIAKTRNDLSTISNHWQGITEADWSGTVRVQVRTLDSLAKQYGTPKFVKVDAEGHDAEVLRGMSFAPALVSFEFLPDNLSVAMECLPLLKGREFNLVVEEESNFILDRWVTAREIEARMVALQGTARYGDVFAREAQRGLAGGESQPAALGAQDLEFA